MEFIHSTWENEFEMLEFRFEERRALLVMPPKETGTPKWMLKTEYFGAFPELEKQLIRRGFHLAYLENHNRWGTHDDLDAKARFRDFLAKEFSLSERCVPIGMSCGGLHAVKQASYHPDMVSVLYLDAPVINLLSCPMSLGKGEYNHAIPEMLSALDLDKTGILSYRDHPLDNIPKLISARIPAVLVCGDSDGTVPWDENGILVKRAYEQTGIPFLFQLKPGCDHHPHGPADMEAVIDFIINNS